MRPGVSATHPEGPQLRAWESLPLVDGPGYRAKLIADGLLIPAELAEPMTLARRRIIRQQAAERLEQERELVAMKRSRAQRHSRTATHIRPRAASHSQLCKSDVGTVDKTAGSSAPLVHHLELNSHA